MNINSIFLAFSRFKNIINKDPNVLYKEKFLQLKQATSPSGKPWLYGDRPNAKNVVVIAPIIHNEHGDSLVFLKTKRPPLYAEKKADFCIEFPAGLVGDENKHETTLMALEKELLEETGYKADKIEIVANNVASSPGGFSETFTMAIADINEDKIVQPPISDKGIIVDIQKIKLEHVKKWLEKQQEHGRAVSGQALSGLFYVFTR